MHLVHVVRCRSLKSCPNLTLAHCSCNMSNMSGPLLGAGLVPKSCWKRGKDSNFPSRCSPSWRIWSQQAGEQNGFAKPQGKLGTTISAFLPKHFVSYHHRRTCQAVQSRKSWGYGSYKVRRYQLQQLISIVRFDNELRWSLQHRGWDYNKVSTKEFLDSSGSVPAPAHYKQIIATRHKACLPCKRYRPKLWPGSKYFTVEKTHTGWIAIILKASNIFQVHQRWPSKCWGLPRTWSFKI